MLFSLGHGQHVVQQSAITTNESAASRSAAVRADTEPLAAVAPGLVAKAAERSRALEMANGGADAIGAGDAAMVSAEAPEPEFGKFRYLFPYGGSLPERPDMPACLDALADSMVEANATAAAQNSQIPPIFTYFGQFIDHDLTANTDRDSAISFIDGAITPAARNDVEANLVNLRTGSLGLDSLYGDDPGQGAFATKLANLMRFPTNTAKMRLALAAPVGGRVPLPSTDSATDLLRLGFLIRSSGQRRGAAGPRHRCRCDPRRSGRSGSRHRRSPESGLARPGSRCRRSEHRRERWRRRCSSRRKHGCPRRRGPSSWPGWAT
jgi:hypothetical protein